MPRPHHRVEIEPRVLSEDEAAVYVGLSSATFRAGVGSRWPAPIALSARRRGFDRLALDDAIDRLGGRAHPVNSEEAELDRELGIDVG